MTINFTATAASAGATTAAYTVTTSAAVYVPWKPDASAAVIQANPGSGGTLTVATSNGPEASDLSTLTYVAWGEGTAGAVSSATTSACLPCAALKFTAGTASGVVVVRWLS